MTDLLQVVCLYNITFYTMKSIEILNQIRKVLGIELAEEKVELAVLKLENGTEIEAESFEADKEVFIVGEGEEKIALPIGDYNLEDGRLLVVKEEGLISEIKEAAEEEKVEEEVESKTEEVEAEEEVNSDAAVKSAETTHKVVYATKEELSEVKSLIDEIKAIILKEDLSKEETVEETEDKKEDVELAEEVVEPIAHNPEALSSQKANVPSYDSSSQLARIRKMIYNN